MKKTTVFLFLTLSALSFNASGQETPTELAQPIVAEGKRLYRSEMASWYGTDLFLENYKDMANIGGYFSYTDKDISKCIFFSKSEEPKVIGCISFDSTYNVKAAKTDLTERPFTETEKEYFMLRQTASNIISEDTLFKSYKNMNLNLIPLISGGSKKVYVLTGPKESGLVVFGNDYLLTFTNELTLIEKKQLHRNLIPVQYGSKQGNAEVVGAMHSHLPETGDFITATDICTLMLYEKFAKWKQHTVVSKKYLNIWNCLTDELTVIPMETVDKIDKDQKKRAKKKNKNR